MSIEQALKARNEALERLDLDWLRALLPGSGDAVLLLAAHKARYDCVAVSRAARLISQEWLRARGFRAMYDVELLPAGVLPE